GAGTGAGDRNLPGTDPRRPEIRRHGRPLRAAGFPPLLHAALRLRPRQGRVPCRACLAGEVQAGRNPPLAGSVPAALFPDQPVQAQRPAQRPKGGLGRLALAARRLARSLGRERVGLAGRPEENSYWGLIPAALITRW